MGFTSKLRPGEWVIDDDAKGFHIDPPAGQSRGLRLGMRSTPYGQIVGAPPFPKELLIDKSEWQARIQEKEQRKDRISDIVTKAGLPCKDQNGTNYCWCNAPTHCVEIVRCLANEPQIILSPASVGGPITGFQNVGGWGENALTFIADNGIVPVDMWPANSIKKSLYTDDAKEVAKDFRVTKWWELVPRTLEEMVSCALRNIPVAIGLNWWSHEVTVVDAVWINGTIAIRIRNSWTMDWPTAGAGGFAILQGSKMYPDDAVAPAVVVASGPRSTASPSEASKILVT